MTTLIQARYDSRNFTFEGFGETEIEARKALLEGLNRHAKEYRTTDPTWYNSEDFQIRVIRLGSAYRDRELVPAFRNPDLKRDAAWRLVVRDDGATADEVALRLNIEREDAREILEGLAAKRKEIASAYQKRGKVYFVIEA